MSAIEISQVLSPQQFLEWELQQTERHEYIDGKIYAMTGASFAHNTISGNVFREIGNYLRSGPCRACMSDMKVQGAEDGPFFYPDIAVTCDERDDASVNAMRHPCLIIEALSPTTEAFDRGSKFAQYRRIPTLQEYVLMDCGQQSIECFRRDSDSPDTWSLHIYGPGSVVTFDSIGLQLPIDTIYEKVRFQ